MVAVICSAVAGALAAVVLILTTHDPRVAAIGGAITFIVFGAVLDLVVAGRQIRAFLASLEVRFPRPEHPAEEPVGATLARPRPGPTLPTVSVTGQ